MRIQCTDLFRVDISIVHCLGGYFFPDTVLYPDAYTFVYQVNTL